MWIAFLSQRTLRGENYHILPKKTLHILIVESPLKKSKLPLFALRGTPSSWSVCLDLAFMCRLDKPSATSQRGATDCPPSDTHLMSA